MQGRVEKFMGGGLSGGLLCRRSHWEAHVSLPVMCISQELLEDPSTSRRDPGTAHKLPNPLRLAVRQRCKCRGNSLLFHFSQERLTSQPEQLDRSTHQKAACLPQVPRSTRPQRVLPTRVFWYSATSNHPLLFGMMKMPWQQKEAKLAQPSECASC